MSEERYHIRNLTQDNNAVHVTWEEACDAIRSPFVVDGDSWEIVRMPPGNVGAGSPVASGRGPVPPGSPAQVLDS